MNYKTATVENTWLTPDHLACGLSHGWGNGYVIIPKNHPFYGVNYNIINHFVNVHGGLTYSEYCKEDSLLIFNLNREDVGKWVIGFDTAHAGDNPEIWHKGAVQAEVDNLLTQVAACAELSKDEVMSKADE